MLGPEEEQDGEAHADGASESEQEEIEEDKSEEEKSEDDDEQNEGSSQVGPPMFSNICRECAFL